MLPALTTGGKAVSVPRPSDLVGGVGFQLTYGGDGQHLERARTVTFCVIAYAQLFLAFASRSHRFTLPQLGFFTNPHLLGAILVSGLLQLSAVTLPFSHDVFGTASHPVWEWAVVFGLALVPVTVIEVAKLVLRPWRPPRPAARRPQLASRADRAQRTPAPSGAATWHPRLTPADRAQARPAGR